MTPGSRGEVSRLLRGIKHGNRELESELLNIVFPELRRIAAAQFQGERPGHTLSPTAIVNEAYLKLVRAWDDTDWNDQKSFYAFAAKLMRHILVDHARSNAAAKRGCGQIVFELNDVVAQPAKDPAAKGWQSLLTQSASVIDIDRALSELMQRSELQSQIAELHIFGGLTFGEVAETLAVSESTVFREWRVARAWLGGHLKPGGYA